jgi:hypothetical protein
MNIQSLAGGLLAGGWNSFSLLHSMVVDKFLWNHPIVPTIVPFDQ